MIVKIFIIIQEIILLKHILLFIIALHSLSIQAHAEWEAIGPFGGYLRALAIDPVNPNILYTASYNAPSKIFRSNDYGELWNHISTVPNYVYCIAIDPSQPNVLYAGSYADVYKSTDNGENWTTFNTPAFEINAIAVRPDIPSIIYAIGMTFTGGQYVLNSMKSIDAGSTWTHTPLVEYGGYAYCLVCDPLDPNTLYIGGYYYDITNRPCVFKSTDGGTTFFETSFGLTETCQRVQSLGIHPIDPNILYAGTYYDGIFRSTNAGLSWIRMSGGGWFFSSIATSAAGPDIAYAAADTVIYMTTNSGQTWFRTGNGYGGARRIHRCVAMSPADTSTVYTTDYLGFYKATNSGTSWYASNYCINIAKVNCMTVFQPNPSIMYAACEGYSIYRTTNSGSDWTPMTSPFACRLGDIVMHNNDPNILFVIEGDG